MDCPTCHKPMERGELSLGQTMAGLLTAGHSYLELFFQQHGEERLTIMTPNDSLSAFRCGACGTIAFRGLGQDDIDCLACGAMIPSDGNVCPKCGWTYVKTNP